MYSFKIGEIEFGQVDANAEYFSAKRAKKSPIFLDTFFIQDEKQIDNMLNMEKYIAIGQKGTGKTAFLRHIQAEIQKQGIRNEFIVFKSEILSDIEFVAMNQTLLFDDSDLKRYTGIQHIIKRFFLLCILKNIFEDNDEIISFGNDSGNFFKDLFLRIKNSKARDLASIAFDTLIAGLEATTVDPTSPSKLNVDAAKIVKKQNDKLLTFICEKYKKKNKPFRLIVDEVHYAYRNEKTLANDTLLVRDIIAATQLINNRFADDNINIGICIGVRSEFVDNPLMSVIDIHHTIESNAVQISWDTYPSNFSNPMFQLICDRISSSIGENFDKTRLLSQFWNKTSAEEFLEHCWLKPRDIIRYFSVAAEMYPTYNFLDIKTARTVLRQYCDKSWNDMKSTLSSFMPPSAITELEKMLRIISPGSFDGSAMTTYADFCTALAPTFQKIKDNGDYDYDLDRLCDLLYTSGVIFSIHTDNNGKDIVYKYHRGNRNINVKGRVYLHKGIARAFS